MARNTATRTQGAAATLLAGPAARGGPASPTVVDAPVPPPNGRATEHDSSVSVADDGVSRRLADRSDRGEARAASAGAHTDWLFHHLRIEGSAEQLDAFRTAASGAGIIPWHLDLDQVEEDAFLRLAAPQRQARTLSLAGARLLAAELRDAVARRHALAVARVGHSHACCFDLHALVPVPGDMLRLGPDHPDAWRWLWTHWGTTDTLRHVTLAPDRDAAAPSETVWRVSFWSADWTPWRALATVRARFPELRFELQPHYDRP